MNNALGKGGILRILDLTTQGSPTVRLSGLQILRTFWTPPCCEKRIISSQRGLGLQQLFYYKNIAFLRKEFFFKLRIPHHTKYCNRNKAMGDCWMYAIKITRSQQEAIKSSLYGPETQTIEPNHVTSEKCPVIRALQTHTKKYGLQKYPFIFFQQLIQIKMISQETGFSSYFWYSAVV